MKLSEISEKLGISTEELLANLEVEGVGKFSELTGKAGRVSELESALLSKQQALAQYEQQVMQLQNAAKQQYDQTGEVPAWYNDELLRPIAQSFQGLKAEVEAINNQKIATLAGTLQQFMNQAQRWANGVEVRELKRQYSDFDEDKVRSYATRTGISDWEAAYNGEKSSRLPEIIKAEVEKARKEGMEQGATRQVVSTEMGNLSPAPLTDGTPKDYAGAWKSLLHDFQNLGMGGNG